MTWQGAIQFFHENSGSLAKGANILMRLTAPTIGVLPEPMPSVPAPLPR
jgi:hypothetical protein